MKRTLTLFAVVLILAAAALAAAPARPAPATAAAARGVLSPEQLAEFLGLTDAQKEQARLLGDTMRAAIAPLHDQLHTNRRQIDDAVDAGNAQKAGELLIANRGLRDQIKAARDTFRTSFEAMLTSEQKAKFAVYSEIVELRHESDND